MSFNTNLREDVVDALDFDMSVDATDIGVSAHEGVVTLSGYVKTYAEKYAAERAAGRVNGVKAIAMDMSVRLPSDKKHSDDQIAARALQVLAWDVCVPDEVMVKVEDGLVTLSNHVEYGFQKRAAESVVRQLGGVTGVINLISVKAQPSTYDVRQNIMNALKRDAQMDATFIQISSLDGRVTLDGTVDSWDDRRIAENAAWRASGVSEVANHLTVSY